MQVDGQITVTQKEGKAQAIIRKYKPEDRDAVRKICYDTGLMGDPIDPYFGCLDLYADYWMNYYTDHEPESAFVAELNGEVVGYLVGCKETSIQEKTHRKVILPKIRKKLFTLGYKVDRRFFRFLWWEIRSAWKGDREDPPLDDYPAHLHMNLAEGYRSMGIGSKLMSIYLDYLRDNDIPGLHLATTTRNRLAIPFYQKWGFKATTRHPLTLYEKIMPEAIEVIFFTREL